MKSEVVSSATIQPMDGVYYYTPWGNLLQQACTTQKARRAKLININSPRAAKVYFVVVWKKF